jgi:diguanylate cyclase (GGDEF)-like protein
MQPILGVLVSSDADRTPQEPDLTDESRVEDDREHAQDILAELIAHAQRGEHEHAISVATTVLADDGLTAEDRILAHYALAVALTYAGRPGEAVHAADQCFADATSIRSAGWQSNALAMRAQILAAEGDVDGAVSDLVEAEVLLESTTDAGLRNWAHSAMGSAYTSLRLYELALPHFELAPKIAEQPVDLSEGPTIDIFNLADLHLRWASELERVGLDLGHLRAEHNRHLQAARRWIAEGELIEPRDEDDHDFEAWAAAFARMRAQVESTLDPESVIETLEQLRDTDEEAGNVASAIAAGSQLARAYRLVGRLDDALAASARAVEQLSDDIDIAIRLDAYHQHHENQRALNIEGAVDVRGYILISAALLWQQRIRSVEAVRDRRDGAVREAQHAFSDRIAREDPLTGVFNRRAIDEWIDSHPEGPATLVMIDLDRFHRVNDEYGEEIGDQVLIRVAETLTRASRTGDLVARIGGDEFVIAIEGGITTTFELCRRIEGSIDNIDLSDLAPRLYVRASSGAASVAVGQSTQGLLERADKDMLESKRQITALSS